MSIVTLLFIGGFLVVIGAFALIVLLTEGDRLRAQKPSPMQYGSGARHERQNLPPISNAVTSVPMGSADPSVWPTSNAVPNRRADH